MEKATLTIKEAAQVIGISEARMYELSRTENFYPLLRVGRKKLILKTKLTEWLNDQAGQKDVG